MTTDQVARIGTISYPNTVEDQARTFFGKVKLGKETGIEFDLKYENGEMAAIPWILVKKDGKDVAYIKMSVCDIYFNE